jgi:hypothetical protein
VSAACRDCLRWKRRGDDEDGEGFGVCWSAVPAVITFESEYCEDFHDRLVNRADVVRWFGARRLRSQDRS